MPTINYAHQSPKTMTDDIYARLFFLELKSDYLWLSSKAIFTVDLMLAEEELYSA